MALTLHGTVSDNTVVLDRRSAKPIIINGDMAVAQRATSTTGITGNGVHTIDRIALDLSDNGTWTQTQSTDVPTGQGFASSLKMDCTTADAAVAAGTYHLLRYKFEGQDCQLFKKGTSSAEYITVAFWIKSNKTGTFTVELFDSEGDDRTISKTFTIDSGDTWEKKVLSFIGDTSVAQPNTNALGLSVNIWMTGGSTFTGGTLQTAWGAKTNNERADTSVNIADSTDNEYYLTGLQVEVGDFDANSIAPFQHESYGDSLARCQRYFFKTFAQGTTPAQNVGANNTLVNGAHTAIQDNRYPSYELPVEMRAAGTATSFNPYAANSSFRVPGSSTDVAISSITITTHAIVFVCTSADTGVFHIHFTVDGEL